MADSENILREALTLSSKEKAELIDKLLSSLDKPNQEKEALLAKEAEERIDAYNQGKIRSVSLEKVLEKYK